MFSLALQTGFDVESLLAPQAVPEPLPWTEVVVNAGLAGLLGLALAWAYRTWHERLSYQPGFSQTLALVTLVIAVVMMVVEGSLARAFALVGALSIIRFRSNVEDVRDLGFVFGALLLGVAAGTSHYWVAGLGLLILMGLTWALHTSQFGAHAGAWVVIRLRMEASTAPGACLQWVEGMCESANLLEEWPLEDGQGQEAVVSAKCADSTSAQSMLKALRRNPQVRAVRLLVSRSEKEI